jgi:hypothetical protein
MATDQDAVRRLLGSAGPAAGTYPVVVFVPGSDDVGDEIDQELWIEEWLRHMATSFRGATAFPPGRGAWRRPDGEVLLEATAIVFSMAAPEDVTEDAVSLLGNMARRFGREARQGEVGVWMNGVYYPIIDF